MILLIKHKYRKCNSFSLYYQPVHRNGKWNYQSFNCLEMHLLERHRANMKKLIKYKQI